MSTIVQFATQEHVEAAREVLLDAIAWMAASSQSLWDEGIASGEALADTVARGELLVAIGLSQVEGIAFLTRTDYNVWPESDLDEALYLHKISIRRASAKRGIPREILNWALSYAGNIGCRFIRLDCDSARYKLCALYESLGFNQKDEVEVGPHRVTRFELVVGDAA
jgi:GNAT superfamily N-acetyltransferase